MATSDTIAAIATPNGSGGVGVIRVSGPACKSIAQSICKVLQSAAPASSCTGQLTALPQRSATLTDFLGSPAEVIDTGIVLFFSTPNSYTGEDVLELQAHGGRVVMDMLLQRVLSLGARMARPGEFTERAYLNGKLDLSQAEAVSDLINSGSAAAARAAVKSLQGEFSQRVHALTEELTNLRIYMEAALDFPEEEIDFLASEEMHQRATSLRRNFAKLLETTRQGQLLRDGLTVVIAGKPNAGKSSLLNRLTGEATAIVTDIKGTTRDLLRERIQLDGLPVQLIDTAGLRASQDPVEQEGIRRAILAIREADRVLWIEDINQFDIEDDTARIPSGLLAGIESQVSEVFRLCDLLINESASMVESRAPDKERMGEAKAETLVVDLVLNKTDLGSHDAGLFSLDERLPLDTGGFLRFERCIKLSAITGEGIGLLQTHLKQQAGYDDASEDVFIARRRHIVALESAAKSLEQGFSQLENQYSPELAAEDFRLAQQALGEITGEVSSDDLLGLIFAGFCIGK